MLCAKELPLTLRPGCYALMAVSEHEAAKRDGLSDGRSVSRAYELGRSVGQCLGQQLRSRAACRKVTLRGSAGWPGGRRIGWPQGRSINRSVGESVGLVGRPVLVFRSLSAVRSDNE